MVKNEQAPQLIDPASELLNTLPTRQVCDRLVGHYMRTFQLIYPTVHVPTFWKEYEHYWSSAHTGGTRSFAIKLGLMLTIGIIFSADGDDEQLRTISRSWIQAAQWWLVGPSEKSTSNLDGIQIFCLLLIARQVTSAGPSPWLSEASLIKVAMAMGLHRDPRIFRLSPLQAEIRTRLWTTVLELAIHGAMDSSTPFLLSELDFDDHTPHNIRDEDFGPDSSHLPPTQELTTFTQSSFQILMRQSLSVRLEIARIVQNTHTEQSCDKAIELSAKLQKACRDIATYCRLHWALSQSSSMHREFLDMQFRRYILLLHRPFMLQARKDPRFYLSQKICLESAMIIASYAQRIDLPSDVLDDLSRLMIMSTGSFRGPLTLDIITILGLDVTNQLEETGTGLSTSSGTLILDPLAEMARAQREPVVRILEHIKEQLLQIIKLGHPTLKRYIFLAGVLAQIRAMESGQSIQSVVVKTAQESLRECYTILQSFRTAEFPQDLLQGLDYGEPSIGLDFGTIVCLETGRPELMIA